MGESDYKPLTRRHKYKGRYKLGLDLKQIPCTCGGHQQPAAKQVLPIPFNSDAPIIWNNCARTLYAALHNQLEIVPLPEEGVLQRFITFAKKKIDQEMGDELANFDYSYSQWYNHLTYEQQLELERANMDELDKPPNYESFCKRELQFAEIENGNIKLPKRRTIATPSAEDKYVMGPICWALERLAEKCMKGVCITKNWNDLAQVYQEWYKQGFTHIYQGDASGLDKTMSYGLKAVDRYIYSLIEDKIHHCTTEEFKAKYAAQYRKLKGYYMQGGKKNWLFSVLFDGTVFSGSNDTTLMNTIRVSLIMRFILEENGFSDDEYRLITKGDDWVVALLRTMDVAIFYKYWTRKNEYTERHHGLGIVLKFVKYGDISSIDFCSTNTLHDPVNNIVHIIRQPKRLIATISYSMKALAYSAQQVNDYMLLIAESIECWGKGLPLMQEYIDFIRRNYTLPQRNTVLLGKNKKTILPDGHRERDVVIHNTKLGRDFDHGKHLRQMTSNIDPQFMYDLLLEQGITKLDLLQLSDCVGRM